MSLAQQAKIERLNHLADVALHARSRPDPVASISSILYDLINELISETKSS